MSHIQSKAELDEHRNRTRQILMIRELEKELNPSMPTSTVDDMLVTTQYLAREEVANMMGDLMQKAGRSFADIVNSSTILNQKYSDERIDSIIKSEMYVELFGKREAASMEDRKVKDNFNDLLDDEENNAEYDPKIAYVTQPRERDRIVEKIRASLPKTGKFPFDEDPGLYHPVVISWHAAHKDNGNWYKHTLHYFGHTQIPIESTPKNVKIRVDVKRGQDTTFLKVHEAQREFRKTTFGRIPTRYGDEYAKWDLIEDFVPQNVVTNVHGK